MSDYVILVDLTHFTLPTNIWRDAHKHMPYGMQYHHDPEDSGLDAQKSGGFGGTLATR